MLCHAPSAIFETPNFAPESSYADKRVALVIGNSAYRNVASLANPANDAVAISGLFKSAHFDTVRLALDLGIADLRRAVSDFADLASDADIAVVYYAGHGIEMDGTNYLIVNGAQKPFGIWRRV